MQSILKEQNKNTILHVLHLFHTFLSSRLLVGFPKLNLTDPRVTNGEHLVDTWGKVLVTSGYTDYEQKQ